KSKVSSVFFIVLFALSAPLGLFLSQHYGTIFLEDLTVLMALAVGVLMHISTTILFESSENHKFNFKRFAVIIVGFMLAIFTL
ncbi:MAG: ZIP family metal transporter, partial [Flavobacteriales bacterium CG_4_10_14_0_8_um_filter_32_5]